MSLQSEFTTQTSLPIAPSCRSENTPPLSVDQTCNNDTAPPSINFEDNLNRLIDRQEVHGTLTILRTMEIDLNKVENRFILQAINNNLYELLERKSGTSLNQWITELLADGYDYSALHSINAKYNLNQGNTVAAMNALFLAKHHSITADEVQKVQTEIEQLVLNVMDRDKEKSHGVSEQSALELLQFVMEKQPENPLFGIEMATLHADLGDIEAAIETLNLIPYHEQFQNQIVSLKTKWLNELNLSQITTTEMTATAIPLKHLNQHYIVTIVINQEQTFDLLIDTGATTSSLSKEAIEDLKHADIIENKVGSTRINTANGPTVVDYYQVKLFAIGQYVVEDFHLLEVELNDEEEFDGLLGMNFLSLFEFELDQINQQLFLTPVH
ncbi:MAG: homoserine O-succinyltransferase [Pseudomonadales bacterium]|nr:homoserine O-succinyltransferase [Pseudomonadales bacterium]